MRNDMNNLKNKILYCCLSHDNYLSTPLKIIYLSYINHEIICMYIYVLFVVNGKHIL